MMPTFNSELLFIILEILMAIVALITIIELGSVVIFFFYTVFIDLVLIVHAISFVKKDGDVV